MANRTLNIRIQPEVYEVLGKVGSNLEEVRKLHQENAALLRQVLGLKTSGRVQRHLIELIKEPLEGVKVTAR